MSALPADARTVNVRIQVVDLSPRVLDLDVPAYLPARDLTQRIARDAGLGANWPGGGRRLFWLRARGRVVLPEETLADLGVLDNELLHLLPEPPADGEVRERPIGLEATEPSPWGWWPWAWRVLASLAWTAAWAAAMNNGPTMALGGLPSAALAASWTMGLGTRIREPAIARVAVEGLVAWAPFAMLVLVSTLTAEPECRAVVLESGWLQTNARPCVDVARAMAAVVMGGLVGVAWGWLGAQRALPPLPVGVAAPASAGLAAAASAPCGVCERTVRGDVQVPCPYGCALVFHQGCATNRQRLVQDEGLCAMCGAAIERG